MNRRSVLGGVAVAAAVVLALAASPTAALGALEWLAADPLRFGVALVALAAIRPFLAWPTTLLAVVAGFGYGWAGVPVGAVLLTATAVPPYWLARAGRARLVNDSRTVERVSATGSRLVADAGGLRAVAGSRFLPVPADAVSVTAGVSGVAPRPFLAGTAIGELPWVVAGVAAGVSADRLASDELTVADPALFVALGVAGVLLLARPLYRAWRTDPTVGDDASGT
ncbi:TVP38/TMEM64 family protein [Halorubrum halodurans]|uniref:TVP38/TMEM64 family protein n=1 Tax=Halorubrum halodurans TaxID=1383851 RepID=A0A256IDB1_9EURY|nr:VTT domain-containing protein [Halorubrum halodurans]OYR54524.1 TVP38/TMEM64 family protein [Halorubrum halodurans]